MIINYLSYDVVTLISSLEGWSLPGIISDSVRWRTRESNNCSHFLSLSRVEEQTNLA